MRTVKKLVVFLLALSMVLGCAACSSSDGGGSGASNGSNSGAKIINVMLETPVESLDPQLATDGTSFEIICDYTDGLMQMDSEGAPVNALCESYEVSADGLKYTFKIRKDANWSNGTPVTASDFVFGWQRAVDPKVASEYSFILSDIGQIVNAQDIIDGKKDKSELGVKAVDEKTLEVNLNVPVSYFLSLLYFPTFYPVNEEFYNKCGDTFGTSPETTLANGAFILTDYVPAATSFSLKKNDKYYDKDRVKLDGLNYQVIQDSQQALMSYQTGAVDIVLLNGEQVDQVKNDPEFRAIGAGYLWYVSPNIAGCKELANLNIRYALTFAIDRSAITESVLKDGSFPSYTAVPAEFATGPDGTDFSKDQEKYKEYVGFDKAKAKEYWEKGKSELGISSLELEMKVDADDAPQKVAQVLKEQWETALPGLTVTIVIEPKKQRVNDMVTGNFQLGLTRWGPDYADPMTYLSMWVTGNDSTNYGRWSNAEFDSIIEECTTGALCTDPKGRWAKMYDAEKIAMQEAVIFPLYTQCNAEMISSKIKGLECHPVAINRVFKNATKE